VEFQTPHYERRIAFFGQKVLTQAHWDTDRALEVMDLVPYQPPALQLVRVEAGVRVEQFVDFPDFRAFRVTLAAGQSCAWETGAEYHLWIAVNGTVSFGWAEGATELSAEESLMMPVARGTYEVSNPGSEPLILLLAQPHSTANG
jgi:quercetin dioxygenase-like cupin family protein